MAPWWWGWELIVARFSGSFVLDIFKRIWFGRPQTTDLISVEIPFDNFLGNINHLQDTRIMFKLILPSWVWKNVSFWESKKMEKKLE